MCTVGALFDINVPFFVFENTFRRPPPPQMKIRSAALDGM